MSFRKKIDFRIVYNQSIQYRIIKNKSDTLRNQHSQVPILKSISQKHNFQ